MEKSDGHYVWQSELTFVEFSQKNLNEHMARGFKEMLKKHITTHLR